MLTRENGAFWSRSSNCSREEAESHENGLEQNKLPGKERCLELVPVLDMGMALFSSSSTIFSYWGVPQMFPEGSSSMLPIRPGRRYQPWTWRFFRRFILKDIQEQLFSNVFDDKTFTNEYFSKVNAIIRTFLKVLRTFPAIVLKIRTC